MSGLGRISKVFFLGYDIMTFYNSSTPRAALSRINITVIQTHLLEATQLQYFANQNKEHFF